MPTTTDPNDPRLGHGADEKPVPQNEVYLVLSEEERAKGFIRPVRLSYKHVGAPAPKYPLRDLTDAEKALWDDEFAKFEIYPEGESARGRFWTQAELDRVDKGCGMVTTMNQAIAETYAHHPQYYSATYCPYCKMHRPVNEFVWEGTNERVGS
jgi:hypothetical protein